MPPITAATIARKTGRPRTNRTVAASVLGLGTEGLVELGTASRAEPGPQKVSKRAARLHLGRPRANQVFDPLRCYTAERRRRI